MESPVIHRAEELLDYRFDDRSLLLTALTHPSYAAEHEDSGTYDRLEFLGDAVLGFIVSDAIFRAYPEDAEGDLTRRKHRTVSGEALSEAADALGIGSLLLLGRGASASGENARASVLENTMEALIGALFLDGGIDAARLFISRALGGRMSGVLPPADDPKSTLQQYTQGRWGALPEYRVTLADGPPHQRVFTVEVYVRGSHAGTGTGRSKQAAEKAAAAAALEKLSATA